MAEQASNFVTTRFKNFRKTNSDNTSHQTLPASGETSSRADEFDDDYMIPTEPLGPSYNATAKCCCGKADCVFLEHNHIALGGLERDLETAAKLGQALIDRHDTYVRESQAEQARLHGYVNQLQLERDDLQGANERIVAENKELLSKLESLNADLGSTGQRVKHLEELLEDCEHEVRRLHGLSRQTETLELKVQELEHDRENLGKQIEDGKDEVRGTLARWRDSERRVKELEQDLLKIEWEARVDRERHQELVSRMEKDRTLERELGVSEGRLKASAMVNGIPNGGAKDKQVVSNFVRDILTDNANLQAGIAELRELLQSSNDEVQSLREQIILHQPMEQGPPPLLARQPSLGDELEQAHSTPTPVQQQVHVHHHYHATPGSKKERVTSARRTGKRKAIMPSSALSSSSGNSTPTTPIMRPKRGVSSPALPLAIQPKLNRWSIQSTATTATTSTFLSSMASSPRSNMDRNASIFDRIEHDEDSSRPTSPESFSLASPRPWKRHNGVPRMDAFEEEVTELEESISPSSISEKGHVGEAELQPHNSAAIATLDLDLTPKPSMYKVTPETKPVSISQPVEPEPPDLESAHDDKLPQDVPSVPNPPLDDQQQPDHPRRTTDLIPETSPPTPHRTFDQDLHSRNHPTASLRRSTSNDSLVSISGMDIHIARHPTDKNPLITPSLRLLKPHTNYFANPPSLTTTHPARPSAPLATLSDFTATTRPDLQHHSASIRALSGFVPTPRAQQEHTSKGLTGVLGGWTRRKWGTAPVPSPIKSTSSLREVSNPDLRHIVTARTTETAGQPANTTPNDPATESTQRSPPRTIPNRATSTSLSTTARSTHSADSPSASAINSASPLRAFGINQTGGIPGLSAYLASKRTPTVIEAQNVDMGGLLDSLGEA